MTNEEDRALHDEMICPDCEQVFTSAGLQWRCLACLRLEVFDKDEQLECLECDGLTDGGKPFCVDHIELMPYVADLLRRMESS